ncbi:maleylpyruvate isomerase N-terminal domain-containing protein [Leucobacter rhizosphaerae]|uniref:Maleylpyruvate isomerase N-terminal domain-containing protein n=1 Tax=Leucobacter rhizosphaerae TaxID=2932245 RepID=A0ABY4FWX9_9MICO|nr:maleylpyruvate isomerase N-terminal domain-containing protein [Leucobacter rhizosphaerae]UOQ60773.1 maleylpyruvate isomerase N-terminal domain-containing protein [Leucobacter rhizosphaerae]
MDPAAEIDESFGDAAAWFAALVQRIPSDGWTAPGLGDWCVRDLVGHTGRALSTLTRALGTPAPHVECPSAEAYFVATAARAAARDAATTDAESDGDSVYARGVTAGRALGSDPAAAISDLVRTARVDLANARRDGAAAGQEPSVTTIVGGMPLREYVRTRTFELVVHGLDLRAAVHRITDEVPLPALPAASLRDATRTATSLAIQRGDGPDLLLALTGRTPMPRDYSVLAPVTDAADA